MSSSLRTDPLLEADLVGFNKAPVTFPRLSASTVVPVWRGCVFKWEHLHSSEVEKPARPTQPLQSPKKERGRLDYSLKCCNIFYSETFIALLILPSHPLMFHFKNRLSTVLWRIVTVLSGNQFWARFRSVRLLHLWGRLSGQSPPQHQRNNRQSPNGALTGLDAPSSLHWRSVLPSKDTNSVDIVPDGEPAPARYKQRCVLLFKTVSLHPNEMMDGSVHIEKREPHP